LLVGPGCVPADKGLRSHPSRLLRAGLPFLNRLSAGIHGKALDAGSKTAGMTSDQMDIHPWWAVPPHGTGIFGEAGAARLWQASPGPWHL